MARSIELVLQDGESLVKALRPTKAKAQRNDIGQELKQRSSKTPEQGGLLDTAIQLVNALPAQLQEAIAETIFANLREEADPSSRRFQELVDAKYTRGLTAEESSEISRLEAGFRDSDDAFYAPILERVKAQRSPVKKRAAS